MATISLSRSDLFPVGTTVGVYVNGSVEAAGYATVPRSVAIATGVVDAAGDLSVTNAGILQGTTYVCHATINGEQRATRCRSTLDVHPRGVATGTGDTTNGGTGLASVSAATGAFAIGQCVTGPGIPPGTYLISGSGESWTMSDKATATATGVALAAYGAQAAKVPDNAGSGAVAVPLTVGTTWQARVRQRRALMGTS